ncbi:replication protein [Glaesserella parasuis]|uniref:replication protein n=1 Tax=Glaesserella parasuis TaxID=738 RepID=UPI002436E35E|nr:replication protein [Glaesserella parasuis]MDG6287415.1 replication protein [Glaesserella parasuis]
MNAVVKVKETPIFKLGENRQSQEARKVSVDDGFTAIPNELLFAMGKFGFTQRQFNLLIAVIQKTLSWHKEMDWISNSQICELVDLPDEQKASKTKQELVRMNVLIQKGNQIGLNLAVTDWKKADCTKDANIAQKMQKKLHKSCNSDCTKGANTKETTTKEKINNTPLPPKGESAIADEQPQAVKCEQHSAKPEKIKSPPMDYQAVADLYNQANQNSGSRLPMVEKINDARRKGIKKLMAELREPSLECAELYFNALFASLRPFHTGENGGWVANFDWAIRPATVLKVREGAL